MAGWSGDRVRSDNINRIHFPANAELKKSLSGMEDSGKGTATPLASLFPIEEAQKAAKRVQDTIAEKEKELDRLRGFVADNNNLVNLVHKLPEELSHDIMVPFGKAAFFPGRLIHTNEFLVLLGEGYYAERTSKQTVEILKRRGKSLDSQVDSLEAMIKDLKAEACFFNATASDAAEGLVEIREDYVEEYSDKGESKSGPLKQDAPKFAEADKGKATADDEEYARMMSRLDELEKEELAAESGNHSDENEEISVDFDDISYQRSIDSNLQNAEDFHPSIPLDQTNNKSTAIEFPEKQNHREDITDQLNFSSLAVQSEVTEGKKFAQNVKYSDLSEKPVEEIVQTTTTSKSEAFTSSTVEHDDNTQRTSREQTSISAEIRHQSSQPSFDSRKAFTGSIIEHAENIQTISREQSSTSSQLSGSQPSKPVSRFKMRRR